MTDMTAEQARELLKVEEQKRLENCQQEIAAVLTKYQCQVVAPCQITPDGRIVSNIGLVPVRGEA